MTTFIAASVKISILNHVLQHFKISIESDFNEILSSLIVCFASENTRSDSADMLEIENTFMIIRASAEKRSC